MLVASFSVQSQEKDTILYSNDSCENPPVGDIYRLQNISFKLANDSLAITGKIVANCCGNHFVIYEIYSDSIYLSRLDEGDLCDCYCLYDINIKLGKCMSDSYKIHLSESSPFTGVDTLVNASQSDIYSIIGKSAKIYPNPFNELTTIDFSNINFDSFTFKMFDCSGVLIKTINNLDSESFQIYREGLSNGFYYFYLYNSNGDYYTGKLLIE